MKNPDFGFRKIAQAAGLMTYMEREKEMFQGKAKEVKGRQNVAYLGTGFGEDVLRREVRATADSTYGEDRVTKIKDEEEMRYFTEKQSILRDLVQKIEVGEITMDDFKDDPLVRAMIAQGEKGEYEAGKETSKKEFASDVHGVFLARYLQGKATASSAGRDLTERYKADYSDMVEAERGDAINHAHIMTAALRAMGKEVTKIHQGRSAATYVSGTENGNVDDGVSTAAMTARLVDAYTALSPKIKADGKKMRVALKDQGFSDAAVDDLEDENWRNGMIKYAETAKQFGWIRKVVKTDKNGDALKDKDGKDVYHWSDAGDDRAMNSYSTYALTGGDEEFVRHQEDIGKMMESEGITFSQAAEKFYEQQRYRAGDKIKSVAGLKSRNAKYDDLFKNYNEKIKQHARAAGHTQYHSNQVYGGEDWEFTRMAAYHESMRDKNGSVVKAGNTHHNPQGVGHLDNMHQEMVYVDGDKLRVLKAVKVSTMNALNGVADERFQNTVLMWGNRTQRIEKRGDNAVLLSQKDNSEGGNRQTLLRRGYGDEEIGTFMSLLKVASGTLEGGGAVATALAVAAKTGQNEIAAKNGKVNIEIDGTDIQAKSMAELMEKIAVHLETNAGQIIGKLEAKAANTDDKVVKKQIQEEIEIIRSMNDDETPDNERTGMVKRLRRAAGKAASEQASDEDIKTQIEEAEQKQGEEEQKKQSRDQAADEFSEGVVQNIEDPEQRRKVAENVEKARSVAQTGDVEALESLAQNIQAGFAEVADGTLKTALESGFEKMVSTFKNNAPELKLEGIAGALKGQISTIDDPTMQNKLNSAIEGLKGVVKGEGVEHDALSQFRTSATDIQDLEIRQGILSTLRQLLSASTDEERASLTGKIKVEIDKGTAGNTGLADKMRGSLDVVESGLGRKEVSALLKELKDLQGEISEHLEQSEAIRDQT